MQTMNISLPEQLKEFVDEQVGSGRYSSVSEYVRDLIRAGTPKTPALKSPTDSFERLRKP